MKTAIVPIIKNKTGDASDKNNYRPIALVTATSKIFELCVCVIMENYLVVKANIRLILAFLQQKVCQGTIHNSTARYLCGFWVHLIKAFDKINHFKLFRKLLDRKTPVAIVRILLFWYSKQIVYRPGYFTVHHPPPPPAPSGPKFSNSKNC